MRERELYRPVLSGSGIVFLHPNPNPLLRIGFGLKNDQDPTRNVLKVSEKLTRIGCGCESGPDPVKRVSDLYYYRVS